MVNELIGNKYFASRKRETCEKFEKYQMALNRFFSIFILFFISYFIHPVAAAAAFAIAVTGAYLFVGLIKFSCSLSSDRISMPVHPFTDESTSMNCI